MSDALTPLRHAYAVEPAGPPPGPGGPGDVEVTLLRQMRRVLDEMPRPSPSAAAVSAVRSAAAVDPLAAVRAAYEEDGPPAPGAELALLRQTADALDQTFRRGPRPRPSAAVVEAVLGRAADVSARPPEPAVDDPALFPLATALGLAQAEPADPVETAVLTQSLDLLDGPPTARPAPEVLAAVRAFAAEASASALAGVRAVYDEAPASEAEPVEVALLRQSREAVERALAARPQPRPSADVLAAVLARAAEASGLDPDDAVAEPSLAPLATALGLPVVGDLPADPIEVAVLEQSMAALDVRPTARPAAGALEGALARTPVSRPSPPRRPGPDRAPSAHARPRRTSGVWAGVGGLLVVAVVAVWALPGLLRASDSPVEVAAVGTAPAEAVPTPTLQADAEPSTVAPSPETAESAPVTAEPTLVAAATPPSPAGTSAPSRAAPSAGTRDTPAAATVALAGAAVPEWEVNDDVRALSLRLQELDRGTAGLGWDAPAEALGAPGPAGPATSTPGLQAVREGAAPARARLRSDSTRQQR